MSLDRRRNVSLQLAYLAGFFDGEGCIRIKKSYRPSGNNFYLTVQVSNSDRLVLEEFKTIFGGSVTRRGRSVNFDMFMWEIHTAEAYAALKTLYGFLKTKSAQASYAIAVHEQLPTMSFDERLAAHDRLVAMKKEVIGNIYENPELLTPAK